MYTLQCNHRPNFLMFDYLRQNRLQYLLSLQPRLTNPTNKYQVLQLCLKQTKKIQNTLHTGQNRSMNSILRILSENFAIIIITQKGMHFPTLRNKFFLFNFFFCLIRQFLCINGYVCTKSQNSPIKIKFLERDFFDSIRRQLYSWHKVQKLREMTILSESINS